jgi:predicted DNA-binding transcriptional regulator YafY
MTDRQQTKRAKDELIARVEAAIASLRKAARNVTFPALADELHVARSTLYRNIVVRQLIAAAKQKVQVDAADIVVMRNTIADIHSSIKEVNEKLDMLVTATRTT